MGKCSSKPHVDIVTIKIQQEDLKYLKKHCKKLSYNNLVDFLVQVADSHKQKVIDMFINDYDCRNDIHVDGLRVACMEYPLNVVKLLVNTYKLDVHYNNDAAFIWAVKYSEDINVIKYLVEDCKVDISMRDNDKVFEPIIQEAYSNTGKVSWEIFYYLLDHGANIYAQNSICLKHICRMNSVNTLENLINRYGINIHVDNDILMMETIKYGNKKMVKFLIDHGVNLKPRKDLALKLALERHDLDFTNYIDYECSKST